MSKNSFLVSMSTAKPLSVDILATPTKIRGKQCRYEWAKFGTCCDTADLREFYKLESKMINHNNHKITSGFQVTINSIKRALNRIRHRQNNKEAGNLHSLLLKAFRSFKRSSTVCWDYMKKVRGSALCSICSGRSQIYFEQDKILISPKTCSAGVSRCEGFFTKLSLVQTLMPNITQVFKNNSVSKLETQYLLRLTKDLQIYSPPKQLTDAFADYSRLKKLKDKKKAEENSKKSKSSKKSKKRKNAKKGKKKPVTLDEQSAKICEMVMNVHKAPYIFVMSPENISDLARKMLAQIKRKHAQTLKKLIKEKKDAIAAVWRDLVRKRSKKNKETNCHNTSKDSESEKGSSENNEKKTVVKNKKKVKPVFSIKEKREADKAIKLIREKFDGKIKEQRDIKKSLEKESRNELKEYRNQWDSTKDSIKKLSEELLKKFKPAKKEKKKQNSSAKPNSNMKSKEGRSLLSSSDNGLGKADHLLASANKAPFESDSLVFSPGDSMFSSFVGAHGTGHAPQKAMNMSLAFP
jgi:hypothetical protein